MWWRQLAQYKWVGLFPAYCRGNYSHREFIINLSLLASEESRIAVLYIVILHI